MVHESLPMLVYNVILMLIFGSLVEKVLGPLRSALAFALCAVLGNAISVCAGHSRDVFMGLQPGLFGLLGAMLGYIIYNWKAMRYCFLSKVYMVWIFTFMALFGMMLSGSTTTVLT